MRAILMAARLLAAFALAISPFVATLAHAAPQNGWWWNPNESGRGFFLEVQGPRMFMSGYFYDQSGRATWLVSNDPMPDPMSYDGRLLAFANGQSLVGSYRRPGAATDAGPVSLRFTDDRRGTLTWAGGSIAIERYAFQRGPNAALQPKTGWWWNPDESGRGFSIELQGDHMFIAAYMYDEAGNPVWYVADAFMESRDFFRGPLLQFANGQTLTGPYRAPTPSVTAGTLTVQFSANNRATVTLSDDRPFAAKATKTLIILPQYELTPLRGDAPKFWVGGLEWKGTYQTVPASGSYQIDVPIMTWERRDFGDLVEGLRPYPASYVIASAFAVVKLEVRTATCSGSVALSSDKLQGNLVVRENTTYEGKVSLSTGAHADLRCTEEDGEYTMGFDFAYDFELPIVGTLVRGEMTGDFPPSEVPGGTSVGAWDFVPRY